MIQFHNFPTSISIKNFRALSVFVVLIFSLHVFSQQVPITKKQFINDSIKIVTPKLFRPQIRMDEKIIYNSSNRLSSLSLDAGVIIKEKLRVMLGYTRLANINEMKIVNKDNLKSVSYNGAYINNNYEFIYSNKRFYNISLPIEFCVGKNTLYYKNFNDENITESKISSMNIIAYLGASFTYKPIRCLGLRLSCGYRKTLYNKIKFIQTDGVYSSVGLFIDIREIIKDYKLYKIKKAYNKSFNSIGTAVDLISD